jgi:hypothetical protein
MGCNGLIIWGNDLKSVVTTIVQNYFDYPTRGVTSMGLGVRIKRY